jgi:DNA repair photolyase
MYENRTIKLFDIVLRREEREGGPVTEEVNLIKVYCMHACKYCYRTPLNNLYMLIKTKKIKKISTKDLHCLISLQ